MLVLYPLYIGVGAISTVVVRSDLDQVYEHIMCLCSFHCGYTYFAMFFYILTLSIYAAEKCIFGN